MVEDREGVVKSDYKEIGNEDWKIRLFLGEAAAGVNVGKIVAYPRLNNYDISY